MGVDLTTTVRGGSGHENAGAFEPCGAPRRFTTQTCVLFGTLLGPAVVVTDQDTYADRERLHIDTDKDGAVWPGGSANGRAPADGAGSVARETEHARAVHCDFPHSMRRTPDRLAKSAPRTKWCSPYVRCRTDPARC